MCFHILYWMGPTNCPERTSVSTSAGGMKLTLDLHERRRGEGKEGRKGTMDERKTRPDGHVREEIKEMD